MKLFLLKIALHVHNDLYRIASKLAVLHEGGLHPKHRIMKYHEFFVDHVRTTDYVLDIGCGNGALAVDLAKKAKHVIGIDIREKNKQAWLKHTESNLAFLVADATTYTPIATVDVVVLSNVLEHIEHRNEFLKHIKHLTPTFLIRVPMINRDWITLYKKELGVEYRLDKTHFTEYTLETFTSELTEAGFILENYSIQFGEIWAVVKTHSPEV